MSGQSNDRLFCWEQIAATNRLFRVSRVFAPANCADKLLPLYALFSAIEQIGSTLSDPDVANGKLNWWRQECLHRDLADSQHPVLKELHRTGAAGDLRPDTVGDLLDGAAARLSARAPADVEALKKICIELFRPQLQLELSVSGLSEPMPGISAALMARNGMLQLLRESGRKTEQGGYWWVPLNMMARHGVGREEIIREPESKAVNRLFSDILGDDFLWISTTDDPAMLSKTELTHARHLFSISGLYERKLGRLRDSVPAGLDRELNRIGPSDVLAAWNGARKSG
ncbi:MAG: squalene/phytoene synthase family protein [Xanthomonadales bacterium]|nr:squalene/phytoene synthase family protein [Gammaproteobacteria bacterium]MBT8055022.1 squalene/phytoene synthase family protein [Gammaproteobacteria bacterium]NND56404.1 squalene/phytoene synthase family protein [Xanthomonadales bacterium]NNK50461.1 squalene/phytoene synthase family protein [Xanthomonadales bacterium]